MACPFCYAPFDEIPASADEIWHTLNTILSWKPAYLTFDGGDPFATNRISELIKFARRSGPENMMIHVDTNGIALRQEHFEAVHECVDLLGLPLEGASQATHDRFRGYPGHFSIVTALLKRLTRMGIPTKVNTVVTSRNASELASLGQLLSNTQIAFWSIYQFWPIGPSRAQYAAAAFAIDLSEFHRVCDEAGQQCPDVRIERNEISQRAPTYLFVTGAGRVFTVSQSDSLKYFELGSVNDRTILSRWRENADVAASVRRASDRLSKLAPNN